MKIKSSYLERTVFWLIGLLLVLAPLGTFLTQIIKVYFYKKNFIYAGQIILILTGWKEIILVAGLVIGLLIFLVSKKIPFRINKLDLYLMALMAIGTSYGFMLLPSFKAIVFGFRYDFLVFLFYFLGRTCGTNKEDLAKLVKIILILSIPVCLFGIAQTLILPKGFMEIFGYSNTLSFTGNPLPPYHLIGQNIVRAMSTFPGPNSFAVYTVMILIFAIFWRKTFKKLWFQILISVVALLGLAFSFSRAHLISLAAALILSYVAIHLISKNKNRDSIKIATKYSFMATATFTFLVALSFLGTFLLANSSYQKGSVVGEMLFRQRSTVAHEFMRELAWKGIMEQPWGHGLGSAGLATTNTGGVVSNPESWYSQIIFEFGWPAVAGLLGLVYFLFRQVFLMYARSDGEMRKQVQLFLSGLIAILLGVSFLPAWYEVGSIMWWVLFGFFTSVYDQQKISLKDNNHENRH